ncbi:MAG: hypothetical protein NT080_03400 [Spirochaetes bacterium]|nr:hypothetical protein [Spirochaetota bacterium]
MRGATLRSIAREAGCSHMNAYHYVDGLGGLLWLAYAEAFSLFQAACEDRLSARP